MNAPYNIATNSVYLFSRNTVDDLVHFRGRASRYRTVAIGISYFTITSRSLMLSHPVHINSRGSPDSRLAYHSNYTPALQAMAVRRKELIHKERDSSELGLLARFPYPPSGPLPSVPNTNVNSIDNESGPSLPPLHPQKATSGSVPPTLAPSLDAELQLVLDHPSKWYAPGDTMTGYIFGCSAIEHHVHIMLLGLSNVSIRDSKTADVNRAPLILHMAHIKPGTSSVIPRFEVKVPHVCEIKARDKDVFPLQNDTETQKITIRSANTTFETKSGHPLPPAMHIDTRKVSSLLSIHGEASISYKIIAVRSSFGVDVNRFIPNASVQLPLRITTRRLPSSQVALLKRETRTLKIDLSTQTAALSKQRRLRLREQLYDAFNSSAPTFYFRMKATMPKLGTPGSELKIGVNFEALPPPPGRSYYFSIPDVTIVNLLFRIRSYTGMRIRDIPKGPQSTAENNVTASRKETFRNTSFRQLQTPENATFKPQEGNFGGQVCVATVCLPPDLIPSFKTYNAWMGYRLECVIRVRVAGKEEEAKVVSDLDIVIGEDTEITRAMPHGQNEDDGVVRQIAETFVGLQKTRNTSETRAHVH